jgi:hypothetical protein
MIEEMGWHRDEYDEFIRYGNGKAFPPIFLRGEVWLCCNQKFSSAEQAVEYSIMRAREWIKERNREIEEAELAIRNMEEFINSHPKK